MTRSTVTLSLLLFTACSGEPSARPGDAAVLQTQPRVASSVLRFRGEARLTNLRQLTVLGDARRARIDGLGTQVLLESTRENQACSQVYLMDGDGRNLHIISPGRGAASAPDFSSLMPRHYFSSTHTDNASCPTPAPADRQIRPLWASADLYVSAARGQGLRALAPAPGYDGELSVSPNGQHIAFTSTRSGDPELWMMRAQGDELRRLTQTTGYDGQASWSWDGKSLVYVRDHPRGPAEAAGYKSLLQEGFVRSRFGDLGVLNVATGEAKAITAGDVTHTQPVFHPDNEHIVFSSNHDDPANMDLYMIRRDGTHLERVTFHPGFDGSPMFTADGDHVVFISTRNTRRAGERRVFLADWVQPTPPKRDELRGQAALDIKTRDARVAALSKASMGGQTPGTLGAERGLQYLDQHFAMIGLAPTSPQGSYRTPRAFDTPGDVTLKAGKSTSAPGAAIALPASALEGAVSGPLHVFEDGTLPGELRGKVVVATQTKDFDAAYLTDISERAGALAMIFVAPANVRAGAAPKRASIPVARITPEGLQALLGKKSLQRNQGKALTMTLTRGVGRGTTHDMSGQLAAKDAAGTLVVSAPWDTKGGAIALANAIEITESLAATPGRVMHLHLRAASETIAGATPVPQGAFVVELRTAPKGMTHVEVEGIDRARGLRTLAREAQTGLGLDVRFKKGPTFRVTLPASAAATRFGYELLRALVTQGVRPE